MIQIEKANCIKKIQIFQLKKNLIDKFDNLSLTYMQCSHRVAFAFQSKIVEKT